MKNLRFLNILWVICISGAFLTQATAQKMPDAANRLYQEFTTAIEASDLAGLELCLCKASCVKMKNEALSYGLKFPDDVFDGLKMGMLDAKYFKFIGFKKSGPTTNVYYTYSRDEEPESIITLCLVEETGQLKIIQLKNSDAKVFIPNLHRKDYSFLETKEFAPAGVAPEIPEAIGPVEYIANWDITCYGYEVSVKINGIFQEEVSNKSRSGVVIGGVRKGLNNVELSIKKTDSNEKEIPAIGIRALINNQEVQVFYMDEEIIGTDIQKTFTVK
jgi:hypothetical protein